jgi:hypothetical protein
VRIRLIGWNEDETTPRAAALRKAGHTVAANPLNGSNYRTIRQSPPDLFLIDLTRLPSHGREVALQIREWKDTRCIPIVFVDGEAGKVERIRRELPDATYSPWSRVRSAIRRAAAHPPRDPVRPIGQSSGYSATPLPNKLGLKPGMTVALIDAPQNFEATLGRVPDGVKLRRRSNGGDMTIWFVGQRSELQRRIAAVAARLGAGGLWIGWPKKASGLHADLNENDVRAAGLAHGLVDFKVCAIDATWSGLRFARKRDK